MAWIIGILAIVCIGLGYYCYQLKKQQQEVIEINQARQIESIKLDADIDIKRTELNNLKITVDSQNKIIQSLSATEDNLRERANKCAQERYNSALEKLDAELLQHKQQVESYYNGHLKNVVEQIELESQKLKDIEAKQIAYLKAMQRQQEIKEKQEYYRLVIKELDLNDIKLLRELQAQFMRKDAIDKLIWEVYYKPAYDILMSHLFDSNDKVCGIYKITDMTTGLAYVGQSVDIKERFRQHIKTSLQYGKATNKLYQQMADSGQYNFTFEILERVTKDKLNERETYWINFYKTKEFGLNKTAGNN